MGRPGIVDMNGGDTPKDFRKSSHRMTMDLQGRLSTGATTGSTSSTARLHLATHLMSTVMVSLAPAHRRSLWESLTLDPVSRLTAVLRCLYPCSPSKSRVPCIRAHASWYICTMKTLLLSLRTGSHQRHKRHLPDDLFNFFPLLQWPANCLYFNFYCHLTSLACYQ